jgi:hypothetical protein
MSVASLYLSDHIIARETPLELLELGLASALRQNFGHSHKLTTCTPKSKYKMSDLIAREDEEQKKKTSVRTVLIPL